MTRKLRLFAIAAVMLVGISGAAWGQDWAHQGRDKDHRVVEQQNRDHDRDSRYGYYRQDRDHDKDRDRDRNRDRGGYYEKNGWHRDQDNKNGYNWNR